MGTDKKQTDKEKATVREGTLAIPQPKRSDLERVLTTAAKPRSLRLRRAKKKRPE